MCDETARLNLKIHSTERSPSPTTLSVPCAWRILHVRRDAAGTFRGWFFWEPRVDCLWWWLYLGALAVSDSNIPLPWSGILHFCIDGLIHGDDSRNDVRPAKQLERKCQGGEMTSLC